MKLKDLINELKQYDLESEVCINYSYYDSNEGECFDSYNNFKFIKGISWNKLPLLDIEEKENYI